MLVGDFVRLDGQCKLGIVGAGAAHANLRLPSPGYIEKIWDQAPGSHFIIEAGGEVTDLQGRRLDFRSGRLLDGSVTGVVASNGVIHQNLLSLLQSIKS